MSEDAEYSLGDVFAAVQAALDVEDYDCAYACSMRLARVIAAKMSGRGTSGRPDWATSRPS